MERGGYRGAVDEPHWRAPAPAARAATTFLYGWRDAGVASLVALAAATPAVLASLVAPALLTAAPTADLLSPIAEARAFASGGVDAASAASPFDLALILAADVFFEAPGRIHLGAKAFAALLAAAALAIFAAVRFSLLQTAFLAAATAAFVAAPFSGPQEGALALLAAVAVCFLCAPADRSRARAVAEGALGGVLLFTLWMSNAALALVGVLALSACPFLSGARGLFRYGAGFLSLLALVAAAELLSPGLASARAETAGAAFAAAGQGSGAKGVFDSAALAPAAFIAILVSAVFGGGDHRRCWMTAFSLLAFGWAAALIVGAAPAIFFVIATAIAVFSTASPFYDGVFRAHDRASIAISGAAGVISLGLALSLILQSTHQFVRQAQAAQSAPEAVLRAFAVVQPPELAVERWVEEGRFNTAEARRLFPLTPADQTAMLLEAAKQARALDEAGFETAILASGDIACVFAGRRDCATDGRTAAARAQVVLVPRFDLDAAGADGAGKAEALLYTEFRRFETTPRWDVWIRRGVALPEAFSLSL
jgi:hypothetical protein